MNMFQRIGMRVATVACLGGFGAPACAPTAARRQVGVDSFVLPKNAPSWVLSPPPGTMVGRASCAGEFRDFAEILAWNDALLSAVSRQCGGPVNELNLLRFSYGPRQAARETLATFGAPCGREDTSLFVLFSEPHLDCR